jgi:hypothetical protein
MWNPMTSERCMWTYIYGMLANYVHSISSCTISPVLNPYHLVRLYFIWGPSISSYLTMECLISSVSSHLIALDTIPSDLFSSIYFHLISFHPISHHSRLPHLPHPRRQNCPHNLPVTHRTLTVVLFQFPHILLLHDLASILPLHILILDL